MERETKASVRDGMRGLLALLQRLVERIGSSGPQDRFAVVWRAPGGALELFRLRKGGAGLSEPAREALRSMLGTMG